MDGQKPAGPVLVIDHDRLIKELLATFFVEFVQLFFPKLAESIEADSAGFLATELFANSPDGGRYQADIVARARLKGTTVFFIIHVEHQSTTEVIFPQRFFRYNYLLLEEHEAPVYPIVIHSQDRPKKAQPNVYRTGGSSLTQTTLWPVRIWLKSSYPDGTGRR